MPHGNSSISLNTHRTKGFEFLKNLIQPFLEGVWVRDRWPGEEEKEEEEGKKERGREGGRVN